MNIVIRTLTASQYTRLFLVLLILFSFTICARLFWKPYEITRQVLSTTTDEFRNAINKHAGFEKADSNISSMKLCNGSDHEARWDFQCRVECPRWNFLDSKEMSRNYLSLQCMGNTGTMKLEIGENELNIPVVPFRHPCLKNILKLQCKDDRAVPKIIHYVWLGPKVREFKFENFLSAFSAYKFLNPCMIFFHGETLPYGPRWDHLLRIVPNIVHIYRDLPVSIFGTKLSHIEHKADIARLEAVLEYGGIYIDTDTIILRSLDPLRDYNFTLSKAFNNNLSNGLIMSVKNATFANIWYSEYKTYNPKQWGVHSTILPFRLSKKYPKLIHVEEKTFVKPNGGELKMLFQDNFNWSKNYAIHLYIRFYRKYQYNIDVIRTLNTTMGSLARHVLFDSKELCIN